MIPIDFPFLPLVEKKVLLLLLIKKELLKYLAMVKPKDKIPIFCKLMVYTQNKFNDIYP